MLQADPFHSSISGLKLSPLADPLAVAGFPADVPRLQVMAERLFEPAETGVGVTEAVQCPGLAAAVAAAAGGRHRGGGAGEPVGP
jgi:hypothetical protein